eukprot:1158862-Pelagomonas_calceolata.AAC.2
MQHSAERSLGNGRACSSPACSASSPIVLPRHRYVNGSSIRSSQCENKGASSIICRSAQGNGEEEELTRRMMPIMAKNLPSQAETLFAGSGTLESCLPCLTDCTP